MFKKGLIIFCLVFSTANAIVTVSKCNSTDKTDIFKNMKAARKDMKSIIGDLRNYKKNFDLPKPIKKKVNRSLNVLKCAITRSYMTRIKCTEPYEGAIAYTLAFIGTTIWVTPSYWEYNDYDQRGVMIHELTHKCFAGDADYFWNRKPQDTNGRAWSGIADTYRYWHVNGTCIPEIDC